MLFSGCSFENKVDLEKVIKEYLSPIGVNRRTRNTYGLSKKGVGTGFYLADETTWLKEKKSKN